MKMIIGKISKKYSPINYEAVEEFNQILLQMIKKCEDEKNA
tara:strand:- start:644 stop:766 length:123 start_codon:yes stop_codon:yes gene_type:complete